MSKTRRFHKVPKSDRAPETVRNPHVIPAKQRKAGVMGDRRTRRQRTRERIRGLWMHETDW